MEERIITVIFVRDYKSFIAAFNKKDKSDYILNVSKLIKDKFSTKFIIPNKVQSFLLNYEIKKLLDKAISVKNRKYSRLIYLNSNLSITTVLNTIDFIEDDYSNFKFNYCLIESKENDSLEISLDSSIKVLTI